MYIYELLDILFLVHNLQHPNPSFPISEFISFSSSSTRAGRFLKFVHQSSRTSQSHHSYLKRVVRLWNALPPIDFNLYLLTIKTLLIRTYHAPSIFSVSVTTVLSSTELQNFYVSLSLDSSSTYWYSISTDSNSEIYLFIQVYIFTAS